MSTFFNFFRTSSKSNVSNGGSTTSGGGNSSSLKSTTSNSDDFDNSSDDSCSSDLEDDLYWHERQFHIQQNYLHQQQQHQYQYQHQHQQHQHQQQQQQQQNERIALPVPFVPVKKILSRIEGDEWGLGKYPLYSEQDSTVLAFDDGEETEVYDDHEEEEDDDGQDNDDDDSGDSRGGEGVDADYDNESTTTTTSSTKSVHTSSASHVSPSQFKISPRTPSQNRPSSSRTSTAMKYKQNSYSSLMNEKKQSQLHLTINMDKSYYKRNPFNEFLTMKGHTDVVREMVSLSNLSSGHLTHENHSKVKNLMASCSSDANIIIWDWFTGHQVHVLKGHRLAVTCMIVFQIQSKDNGTCICLCSGSLDKTIKIWDVETGKCVKTLTEHSAAVEKLCILDENRFCSGGDDRELFIWGNDGCLIGSIERQEEGKIHAILAIPGKIVTASNTKSLYVYDTEDISSSAITRDCQFVQCLVKVNESYFASASSDGSIKLWNIGTLKCERDLYNPFMDADQPAKGNYSKVHYLAPINNYFLAASIQRGFCVFDIRSGWCVLKRKDAHNTFVKKLISLHHGNILISCSDDSYVKVWYTHQRFNDAYHLLKERQHKQQQFIEEMKQKRKSVFSLSIGRSNKKKASNVSTGDEAIKPKLIGELDIHCGAVNDVIYLSEYNFASCGSDHYIFVWNDARIWRRLRNFIASEYVKHGAAKARQLLQDTGYHALRTVSFKSPNYSKTVPDSPVEVLVTLADNE